ncbi:MAG: winged helix-turn-helix domain-containing protein [Marinobacterium sp.]|nr:winged helix-turn-helix domain-containing protein [Marinobacterium sp.]
MSNPLSPPPSRQQCAFFRKLYLSHLICKTHHNLTSLQQLTGMPRRTIQDCLKDLSDIGIQCHFTQSPGGRHNDGHYQITDWGPIHPEWISQNLELIEKVLFQTKKA